MPTPIGSRLDPLAPLSRPDDEASSSPPSSPSDQPSASDSASLVCLTPPDAEVAASSPTRTTISGPRADMHAPDPNDPDDLTDLYAGAFALKGRDQESGLEVEVFSVSAHNGSGQYEAQAGLARLGMSSDNGHFNVRGEAFTAKAHVGVQNPDGSVGVNVGMGVTAIGGEATATVGPISLTGGASISMSYAASIGLRDGDRDGKPELCGRVELAVYTLGACVEKFW